MPPNDDSPKRPELPKSPFLKKSLDDCDRPACEETVSYMQAAMNRVSKVTAAANKTTTTTTSNPQATKVQCPPRSAELGNASWKLLHTMAAWYPEDPSVDEQRLVTGFYAALARFYPCTWCAKDFTANLREKPVKASSRKDLCVWLCEQHNLVNEKTGKPLFPCTMRKLDERWRKSSHPDCESDHH